MRSPSARVLRNRVDVYAATAGTDAVNAPTYTYPSVPTRSGVPCSVQAGPVEEVVDEQRRVTQERQYKVMFPGPTGTKPRDKLIYRDDAGVAHTLIVHVEQDQAGRGAAFVVRCVEKSLI